MSKASVVQRLADQDNNWRRPRSPALAIPGASPGANVKSSPPIESSPSAFSKSLGSRHANNNNRLPLPGDGHNASSHSPRSRLRPSPEEKHVDLASSTGNWRAHPATVKPDKTASSPATAHSGSLGSHHGQHRKHLGFVASSNASEVARRAFEVSEIGSIGSPARHRSDVGTSAEPSTSSSRPSHGDANRGDSGSTTPSATSGSFAPMASLQPLRVSGFEMEPKHKREPRKENWAETPTSSLPSLPASPSSDRSSTDHSFGAFGGALASRSKDKHLVLPQSSSSPSRVVLDRMRDPGNRLESAPALQGRFDLGELVNGKAAGSSSAARGLTNGASPRKGPASVDAPGSSTLGLNNGTTSNLNPLRLPSEMPARFRHSVDPPASAPAPVRNAQTKAREHYSASPGRHSDLPGAAHGLRHSRGETSTSAHNNSNFSSPSSASVASLRPTYGVYRPPHLRHQDSFSGLKPRMSHYDRVRTSSLRGTLRSPDPFSRPGSTVPPAIPEDAAAYTPSAGRAGIQRAASPRATLTDSPARLEVGQRPRSVSISTEAASDEHGNEAGRGKERWDDSQAGEEFDLSHEDMMQMKTSLTDSYCLSRRSSMMIDFKVGNGFPVVDIFQIGDRLGPGMVHDGYPIVIAETSIGFNAQMRDVTGTQLEVKQKLGEGSYAVVYLVEEVAGNGQVLVGPKDDEMQGGQDGARPIEGAQGHEEEADTTVRDNSMGGATPSNANDVSDDLDEVNFDDTTYSSTLRASEQPRRSFASRAAAEDEQAREDSAMSGSFVRRAILGEPIDETPGIDQPHEGRLFALKCLCKRDLSEDMLELQRLESTIHQSIPPHNNIVTLYRTYETPEWLFLVLEYCPGQDLFFWLEQAHDADGDDPSTVRAIAEAHGRPQPDTDGSSSEEGTPPSPSLLASTSAMGLLSRKRLRLISKMFRQMCTAVQFCHNRGIAHRDIKPENFIVEDRRNIGEDGQEEDEDASDESRSASTHDGSRSRRSTFSRRVSAASASTTRSDSTSIDGGDSARRGPSSSSVVVKLTDFGLATAEKECRDFDCGSKPYMAYECAHNITSFYDPQQADVWSLGIVLLNMIFHRSPFREPNMDRCESFRAYCYDPLDFLMNSFEGLTEEAAHFLSSKVLCNVIPRPEEVGQEGTMTDSGQLIPIKRRISAREFGEWAKDLPNRFGLQPHEKHKKIVKRGGYSSEFTSPLVHSRAGSGTSSYIMTNGGTSRVTPTSSPRRALDKLMIAEGDDRGAGQYSLFPEYGGLDGRSSKSGSDGKGRRGSSTPDGQHRRPSQDIPPLTPETLPSPTFSPRPIRPSNASGGGLRSIESLQRRMSSTSPSPTAGSPSRSPRPAAANRTPTTTISPVTKLASPLKSVSSPPGLKKPAQSMAILAPPQVVVEEDDDDDDEAVVVDGDVEANGDQQEQQQQSQGLATPEVQEAASMMKGLRRLLGRE